MEVILLQQFGLAELQHVGVDFPLHKSSVQPVGPLKGYHHLVEGKAVVPQAAGFEQHLILLLSPARGNDLRHAGHRQQTTTDDGISDGTEFERRVPVRFQVNEHDFAHDGRHRRQVGLADLGRQRRADLVELLGYNLPGAVDILSPIEFDPNDCDSHCGSGTNAPHSRRPV